MGPTVSTVPIISLILLMTIGCSDCDFGQSCPPDSPPRRCASQYLGFYPEKCVDGRCVCNDGMDVSYAAYDMVPYCDPTHHSLKLTLGKCTGISCQENSKCINSSRPMLTLLTGNQAQICVCKEGYVRAHNACRKPIYQGIFEKCRFPDEGPIYVCEWRNHTSCSYGKCLCDDSFFFNETSKECEPFENYLQAHNLTSYKVKPKEYCKKDSHCIDGLECKNNKCSCPSPCKYKSDEEICDCGEVEKESADLGWPVFVGIFLSGLILWFWISMCRKTVIKYKRKKLAAAGVVIDDGREETASPESIPLSPVASSSAGGAPSPPPMTKKMPGSHLSPAPPSAPQYSFHNSPLGPYDMPRNDPPPSYLEAIAHPQPYSSNAPSLSGASSNLPGMSSGVNNPSAPPSAPAEPFGISALQSASAEPPGISGPPSSSEPFGISTAPSASAELPAISSPPMPSAESYGISAPPQAPAEPLGIPTPPVTSAEPSGISVPSSGSAQPLGFAIPPNSSVGSSEPSAPTNPATSPPPYQ